jgi:hypothetical protein
MLAQHSRLSAGAAAKLRERNRLPLVFVDPRGNKRATSGSGVERFDEVTELHPTLLHLTDCIRPRRVLL